MPVEITEQVNTVNGSKSLGHSVFPQESQRNLHLKLLNELLKSAPCPEEGKGDQEFKGSVAYLENQRLVCVTSLSDFGRNGVDMLSYSHRCFLSVVKFFKAENEPVGKGHILDAMFLDF